MKSKLFLVAVICLSSALLARVVYVQGLRIGFASGYSTTIESAPVPEIVLK